MPALKERAPRVERLFEPAGGRTLDEAIVEALNDASRGDPVSCPVCELPGFAPGGEDALECSACGSRLE